MSDPDVETIADGSRRRIGKCGNCNSWVWSDQKYVMWCGFQAIHLGCFE